MSNEHIIRPNKAVGTQCLRGVWKHRHVLSYLVQTDVVVRYKQTMMGVAWVALQPILEAVTFVFVFRNVFNENMQLPYMIFVFVGIAFWTFFAASLQRAANSIVGNTAILQLMYVPKVLIPCSVVCSRAIDFGITVIILCIMLIAYGVPFTVGFLWLVPLIGLLALATTGAALWLSIAYVYYRDIELLIPYVFRIAMFLTPVVYPLEVLPAKWHWLIALNPLTGIITSARTVIATGALELTQPLLVAMCVSVLLLLSGILFFSYTEGSILDEL